MEKAESDIVKKKSNMKHKVSTQRRRFGEFFTPLPFAKKALEYIERSLGKEWWKSGEYRLWDMATGTGNLEYYLPQDALKYCYLSTYYDGDVEHLEKLFPDSTIFQYDYLNDDVNQVFAQNGKTLKMTHSWKMPETLRNDLNNPKLKWIILINPPFATAQEAGMKGKSKARVADTLVRQRMHSENLGEVSRELFSQFIYRIKNEFEGKQAFLGLFSKLKYLNANNDQRLRDKIFHFSFLNGFVFSSVNFHGTSRSSQFPIGFILWDLLDKKKVEHQKIVLDAFNEQVEKFSIKEMNTVGKEHHLSKWIVRPPATQKFPPFSSAIKLGIDNVDKRDRIAPGFLASLMCAGNDFQQQMKTAFLSGPQVSAGALSVTPENFEQAVVVFAARLLPKITWLNDGDQWMQPNKKLSKTFITDCAVWSLFSGNNHTVAMKNVKYQRKTYQIVNHFFPFSPQDFSGGVIADWDIEQSRRRLRNTFVADWLALQKLSPLAKKILESARQVYAMFYGSLNLLLRTPKFKIETFDAGWWQIRMALQDANSGEEELSEVKMLHNKMREKLLKQLVEYGIVG